MANEVSKQKLRLLATRIQKRDLTYLEERALDTTLEVKRPDSRQAVKKLLAESLNRTDGEIIVALASHNDSDRVIDDIINQLGK